MKDSRLKLLVVEDDDLVIQTLRLSLPEGWALVGVNSQAEIPPNTHFDAAFVDIHLTGDINKPEGLKAIKALNEGDPHLEIVAISGDLNRDLMEQSLKFGASRFLAKPLTKEEVHLVLDKIEALHLLKGATTRSKALSLSWVGESSPSRDIRRQIAAFKGEGGPILIEAESGAGKEVAARLIHEQESDSRPFVSVNVAALPENIFESELFGHIRGAFTGADQNKMGLAEAAHGGDLFLDEIEALPLNLQPKLLRFLENGEVRRVGGKDTIRVQVRVLAATNQNLQRMVREGKFREDLLYRLSGKRLLLPPLRERKEDLAALAEFFVSAERPRRNKTIEPDAVSQLQKYDWPGNVRELKRVCEQLTLIAPLPVIRAEDVRRVLPAVGSGATQMGPQIDLTRGLDSLLAEYEAQLIRMALTRNPDIEEAIRILGISRSSLYKKIKDYNISTES